MIVVNGNRTHSNQIHDLLVQTQSYITFKSKVWGHSYDPELLQGLIQYILKQHRKIVAKIVDHRIYHVAREDKWEPLATSTYFISKVEYINLL